MTNGNNNGKKSSSTRKAYRVIGTRPVRPDGADKVTGRARYGADISFPNMLYGAVLRSPHAHARVLKVDVSRAAALEGVKAIVTAQDLPQVADKMESLGETSVNLRHQRNNVLAEDKVLYYGHPVAAVAAVNRHVAEDALALIEVEYEVLEPVLDVRKAMEPDAPLLLDNLFTDRLGEKDRTPSNIASVHQYLEGDVSAGFEAADVVLEREFTTETVHQGYIEPQNATALYNHDGQVRVWTSTQAHFIVRDQLADLLDIPVSRIQVTPMEIGGGFGGKIGVYLEPLAILLSKKSGYRPVKMTMQYDEVLAATGPTPASYIKLKVGADKSGRLTAVKARLVYAAGAFPGSMIGAGMACMFGCYKLENFQIDGYDVVVNKPKAAAYRAPGAPNSTFASESLLDELAERLEMDPIALRLVNVAEEGDRRPDGPINKKIGFREVLEATRSHPHYTSPLEGPNRGRGMAIGMWFNYGGKSSASASVNEDGTIVLVEGSVDIGGSRASIAMQLAETLQIPYEQIKPSVVDTDSVGFTEGTYGSRTTFATGWAVYNLGLELLEQLKGRAADLLDVEPGDIQYEDSCFFANDGRTMTFNDLASRLGSTGGPVTASTSVQPKGYGSAACAHLVDLEVDPETGKVQVLRHTVIQDAGKAIHPDYVEGQLQGGAAQGVGWALNEACLYDEKGRLLNATLLDYRMPIALDLPMIDTVIVEVPNPGHPFGVRGVGEPPIVAPQAAVANGIYHATGLRMTELPMAPNRVLEKILDQKT